VLDYVPEPYRLKWLFCNWCGTEQAASANDRATAKQMQCV